MRSEESRVIKFTTTLFLNGGRNFYFTQAKVLEAPQQSFYLRRALLSHTTRGTT
jgi:hypothetical protein